MQEELKLKKDEKNTIINDGIFFKIVVTEDNKIYMLFSNPVMLRQKLMTKRIEAAVV